MELSVIFLIAAVFIVAFAIVIRNARSAPPPEPEKYHLGDVTLESLRTYCGYDWSKPVLVAIQGKVYDVTSKFSDYGPGKPKHVYAGREIARALALESVEEADCSCELDGLIEEQLVRLAAETEALAKECDCVGQVVPLRDLTAAELALHDGSDPALPLLLAIRGTVYDITKGRQFYGPDGVYPFAGKEVARAFALFSTDLADCNDDLEGLGYVEMEQLRDWTGKFNVKYPIVGRLVPGGSK